MKENKDETSRRAYIRLLDERANLADAAESDERDAILYAELIDKGYLRGTAIRDASKGGMTVGAAVTEITLEGRLFLQHLKSEERQESFVGRFKTYWPFFSGLVGVVMGWLLSSWHPFAERQRQLDAIPLQAVKSIPPGVTPAPQATPKP